MNVQSSKIKKDAPPASAVLASLPLATLLVNRDDQITFVNPHAQELFALSQSRLVGKTVAQLAGQHHPFLSMIRRLREGRTGISGYGVTIRPFGGREHLLDFHLTMLADNDGMIVAVLCPSPAQAGNYTSLRSDYKGRSIASMSATLAHEVKNPLSGIRGAAQLLGTGASEEDKPLVDLICRETDRICALIDRMNAFEKSANLHKSPVNIHSVLDHVLKLAQNGFAVHVRFDESYDPSLPPVFGDRDELIQVFLNLIKNAAEAVPKVGGIISISTSFNAGLRIVQGGEDSYLDSPIKVSIKDNGAGIPGDIKPHLFEPFITSKASGGGLGLPLVAKIVHEHGGVVRFKEPPEGAEFNVFLRSALKSVNDENYGAMQRA